MKALGLIVVTMLMSACMPNRMPPSAIIQKAETCGAGDLSSVSVIALQDWFAKHRECAVAVNDLCAPIRPHADARWADVPEGRVCAAAQAVAQWKRKPNEDRRTFESGWK